MTPPQEEIFETLRKAYAHSQRLLMLFDYDGTLTPLTAHPQLAQLEPSTRRVLQRLAGWPRISLGIVSGRALEDLRAMVGLPRLYYAGTVGLEMDLRGTPLRHPLADPIAALMTEIRGPLEKIIRDYPGAWLENKNLGLTVHYRQVEAPRQSHLCLQVTEVLEADFAQLHLEEGPLAVEITPKFGWNKANAVEHIIEHLSETEVFPLYAGDGANDQAAFEAVAARDGIGVGIGPQAPRAALYRLADPHELVAILARFDRTLAPRKRRRPKPAPPALSLPGR